MTKNYTNNSQYYHCILKNIFDLIEIANVSKKLHSHIFRKHSDHKKVPQQINDDVSRNRYYNGNQRE